MVTALADGAVLLHRVVAELAGALLRPEVQTSVEHEPAADPRAADDAHHVVGAASRSETRLGQRERVPVVDQVHVAPERRGERPADRAAAPVAEQIGEEERVPVGVEEPRQGDADRVDLARGACELDHPLEHGLRAALVRACRCLGEHRRVVAVEQRELDVRAAEVEAEAPHRAVQPPSTVSTVPVTNGAVAR